jgi:hypothetical protein
MLNDERIETIKFATRFVNQEAINALTDISCNTYIIKGSTGLGATTALLNYTCGNYIIISPNVGMIEGKEEVKYKFNSSLQLFIYSKSIDKWKDVEEYLEFTDITKQNLIINTTPDQLLILWKTKKSLYEKLLQIPVFVDEIHAYFEESDLREDMGAALELIYNEWKACFTLSTATPTFNFLDIPKDKDIKFYKLVRENDKPKKLQYSSDIKHLEEFVYDEHSNGNRVIVFSNNLRVHKKFTDLRVANLVGDNLALKLAPFGRGNLGRNINYKDYDVIILSSRYFAGYDLDMDCSICIVSEQANEAYKINVQNLVQSYGRVRQNVPNALYINTTSTFDTYKNMIQIPRSMKEVNVVIKQYESELSSKQSKINVANAYYEVASEKCITQAMYVNRSLLFSDARNKINDYHQYNESVFIDTIKVYNFEVDEYDSTHLETKSYKTTKLNQRLLNLLSKEEYEFERDYTKIKYNIRHLKKGAFNCKLALEYLTAYLVKMTGSEILMDKLYNKSFSVKDFYKSMDLFLRTNVNTQYYFEQLSAQEASNAFRIYNHEKVAKRLKKESHLTNDWQTLYAIHQITSGSFSSEIRRNIIKHIEANDYNLYRKYINDKNHRTVAVKKAILKRLEGLSEYLNIQELEWLNEVVEDVYKRLDKGKELYPVTENNLKIKMVDYLVFLMTDGNGYHGTKLKKSREYNSMVILPRVFRKINPLIYLEIDLTAANPQLIDRVLGSNIGLYVYANLMKSRNISRDEAKKLYNTTVNNHELSEKSAKKVYLDCGYHPSLALKLSKLTAQVPKGSFYEFITPKEKKTIESYQRALGIKSHRYHDGIVVSKESIDSQYITIPTQMDGYKYHVNVHNDGIVYEGLTTDVPHSSKESIENYQYLKE